MDNELVERLLDGELQQLREDLLPYKDKSIGWLRIDMGEVRKIIAAVEAFTEAATTITHLTEYVAAQAREIEGLRNMLTPQWFYADGYSSEDCCDSPDEVVERLDMEPGHYVQQIDCAGPMPSIWCAVHIRTNEEMDALETDDRVALTEHASEEDAARALTGGPHG